MTAKAKKTDIWMPLYVAEYLADTLHLSTEQHGSYFLMLMACWKNEGCIPADDESLAAITKLPLPVWKKSRSKLVAFFTLDGDWLIHRRVVKERERAQTVSNERSQAGKAGAAKKAAKKAEEESKAEAIALANAAAKTPANTQQSATQSQVTVTPSVPDGTGGEPPKVEAKAIVFANGVPLLLTAGVAEKNARSMLAMLCKQHGDEAVAVAIQRCAETNPVEPVSWLQATLKSKATPTKRFDHGIGAAARTAFEMPHEREVING